MRLQNNRSLEDIIKNASPAKLVELLYSNAIERLNMAEKAIKVKNNPEANKQIIKVEDIITELNLSLNMNEGGEISKNLSSLYNYIFKKLIEANLKKDLKIIDEIRTMLKELLTTWQQAMKNVGEE